MALNTRTEHGVHTSSYEQKWRWCSGDGQCPTLGDGRGLKHIFTKNKAALNSWTGKRSTRSMMASMEVMELQWPRLEHTARQVSLAHIPNFMVLYKKIANVSEIWPRRSCEWSSRNGQEFFQRRKSLSRECRKPIWGCKMNWAHTSNLI